MASVKLKIPPHLSELIRRPVQQGRNVAVKLWIDVTHTDGGCKRIRRGRPVGPECSSCFSALLRARR